MSAATITGWSRLERDDAVELVAPEGVAGGVVTVRERMRPLVRLDELIARWAGPDAEISAPPEVVETEEGEQGATVALIAQRAGKELRVEIGIIVGDGFYHLIVGAIAADSIHVTRLSTEVRRLVESTPLGLGDRRRLVIYDRPAHWRGCSRGLETDWFAPGFPGHPVRMTVFPAAPADSHDSVDVAERGIAEIAAATPQLADAQWRFETRTTRHGLFVMIRSAVVGDRVVDIAVACDGHYVYAMRLERPDGDPSIGVLYATFDSVVPVPRPQAEPDEGLAHWAM